MELSTFPHCTIPVVYFFLLKALSLSSPTYWLSEAWYVPGIHSSIFIWSLKSDSYSDLSTAQRLPPPTAGHLPWDLRDFVASCLLQQTCPLSLGSSALLPAVLTVLADGLHASSCHTSNAEIPRPFSPLFFHASLLKKNCLIDHLASSPSLCS